MTEEQQRIAQLEADVKALAQAVEKLLGAVTEIQQNQKGVVALVSQLLVRGNGAR